MFEVTLDELIELCPAVQHVRDEDVSPDTLLLNVFWDPDHADDAIDALKGHARECDEPRRGKLLQLVGLVRFASTLGALQRKHLLALYPPATAFVQLRNMAAAHWTRRACGAASAVPARRGTDAQTQRRHA